MHSRGGGSDGSRGEMSIRERERYAEKLVTLSRLVTRVINVT